MLRITRTDDHPARRWRLEGKLVGPWVDEVAALFRGVNDHASLPTLDLAQVTFADTRGVRLLRELRARGAQITACSSYLTAVLQLEDLR